MPEIEAFALQINSDCDRACTHCFFEYDGKISFKEFEKILSQIAEMIHNYPGYFNNSVQLVGREPLLYRDDGKNLGDVVDLIHSLNLRLGMLTRGFSNQEKEKNSISYQNMVEFLSRFPSSYKPVTAVSFDTYNDNPELASEIARNTIESFLTIDSLGPDIMTTTSIERAGATYRALVDLMGSLSFTSHIGEIKDLINFNPLNSFGYGPATIHLFHSGEDRCDEEVGKIIVDAYQKQNTGRLRAKPRITFWNEKNKHIEVTISSYSKHGNGAILGEMPMSQISHCDVVPPPSPIFTVRPDSTLVACCSSNCLEIPAIGSLKEKTLDELMGIYTNQYAKALVMRQKDFGKKYFKDGRSICSTCAQELPLYLFGIGRY